jgi:hypothetical protein
MAKGGEPRPCFLPRAFEIFVPTVRTSSTTCDYWLVYSERVVLRAGLDRDDRSGDALSKAEKPGAQRRADRPTALPDVARVVTACKVALSTPRVS